MEFPEVQSRVVQTLLVALAYLVTARLALLLAIPPGYATPVWPAAGLALVAVLHWGPWMAVGVALGSTVANVHWASDPVGSAVVAAAIGTGAGLQAWVGGALVRRQVGYPHALDSGRPVALFQLLGGPVACVVSATCGVATLWSAGAMPAAEVPYNWATWWTGDTIGVVLVAPLLLIAVGEPRGLWRSRGATVGLPIVAALAAAAGAFAVANTLERQTLRQRFEALCTPLAGELHAVVRSHGEVVEAVGALFAASAVDREAFSRFGERALQRQPALGVLEWVPLVPASERAAFEAATARATDSPGFRITERRADGALVPAGPRATYLPVDYLAPAHANRAASGFDLGSDPTRRAALEHAGRTGTSTVTGPLTLVQDRGAQTSVLLISPVYTGGLIPPTEALRARSLRGFGVGVLRMGDVLAAALPSSRHPDIVVAIHDADPVSGHHLLASEVEDAIPEPVAGLEPHRVEFDVGGRTWVLTFRATPELAARWRAWGSWAILAMALLVTAVLGAFLLVLTGRTERVERSNEELERFAAAASHDLKAPLRGIRQLTGFVLEDLPADAPEETREHLTLVIGRASRMSRLLDALLAYARAGATADVPAPVETSELVREVVDLLEIPQGMRVTTAPGMPRIVTHVALLQRVLLNLISNAVKHHDRPEGAVEVAARVQGRFAEFTVCDDGPGIPEAHREKVFDLFRTLKPRDQVEGSGMGLAICRRTIEAVGGRIEVDDASPRGARFTFTWPVLRPN